MSSVEVYTNVDNINTCFRTDVIIPIIMSIHPTIIQISINSVYLIKPDETELSWT